ncbi:MAG: 3-oxo-5-alpha-steroid 4-dehydrogenase 1 [Bacteroidia bacterium]|jgi:3-oxo-5-alpha-steroid 4-dehydrogenase 1
MTIETINLLCIIWSGMALATFVLLQFVKAPYGRHIEKGWGKEISNRIGWIIMELPSFLIILYFAVSSQQSSYALLLSLLWLIHYFNRSVIFPFRIKTSGKKMPLIIALSAILFNTVNAGLNGYYLAHLEHYDNCNFMNWNFWLGIAFFAMGFYINQRSDYILMNLRKTGETGYKIPFGFLFDKISCPNHFGEIVQWLGFAIMAWNLPASTFLIWTLANLLPRSLRHHKWYKEKFEEYPEERKAVIPWLV